MKYAYTEKKRFRRSFSQNSHKAGIPSLLRLQQISYRDFLQKDVAADKRGDWGLQQAFKSVFPIYSSSGVISLEFKNYELKDPIYDVRECKERGLTYFMSVYANILMVVRDRKGGDIKSVKEERVYMGDVPVMTEYGSFIINGTERVVVSQLHRSPGVYFEHDSGRGTLSQKYLYSARIIPHRGRWLDFEFDHRDYVYFRIDRRRKMPVSILLKAVGYSEEDILREFYDFDLFTLGASANQAHYRLNTDFLQNATLPFDIVTPRGAVLVAKDQRIKKADLGKIAKLDPDYPVDDSFLEGKRLARAVVDAEGEVVARANAEITGEMLAQIRAAGVRELQTLHINELNRGPYIAQTLALDEGMDEERSRTTIYRMLRPGEPPGPDMVNKYLDEIFFDDNMYDLSKVGRMKFNRRLDRTRPSMEYRIVAQKEGLTSKAVLRAAAENLAQVGCYQGDADAARDFLDYIVRYNSQAVPELENLTREQAEAYSAKLEKLPHEVMPQTTLSRKDILSVVLRLVALRNGEGNADDIDSLANRRVRMVGEFVVGYFRQGLERVERAIRDRLSRAETEGLMPHELISAKAISGSVSEFFNGNQLSQFMDQTNPLSEITHKRRVSAFGVGGLTRERVGFEVRDVHATHYGRLCPIETPEGQNIGLINSMALFSSIDDYGFLQTDYLKVEDGRVTGETVHLSAIEEEGKIIVQANSPRDDKGNLTESLVSARRDGEYIMAEPREVDYMDVSPAQIASVAASMIPFLEHNDANRALMGSNMQRQAVPCLRAEKPLVGTGVERLVASDGGVVVRARRNGCVSYVDAEHIVVSVDDDAIDDANPATVDIYGMIKYVRSNQNTNINQHPIVSVGDRVATGDVVADGAGTDMGELSLGQNLLVAFLPWNGYNFEDSILISERVVAEQRYASVHILEEVVHARSTQMGDEEITRDIPHQSDWALRNLDEEGIVKVGVEVQPNDILVGKITPKGERVMSPEEKVLQAVFGDKANDSKDTSLRMPVGSSGVVIGVKVFMSEEVRKRSKKKKSGSKRAAVINEEELRLYKERERQELEFFREDAAARVAAMLGLKADKLSITEILKKRGKKADVSARIDGIVRSLAAEEEKSKKRVKEMERKLIEGHDLPQGILKTVKVYVAVKRNLQVGDKMAGRHGNKGVVSKIEPVESMPYLRDGTPVDIVLNPLGVPSRMNVGQILETHLGFAAKGLGDKINDLLREETAKQMKSLRAFLNKVYAGDCTCVVDDLNDEEMVEMAKNLGGGVPFATPIFDGASEDDIGNMLALADLPRSGQVTLYDGRSGEPFSRPVTVGYMYMMKLHHLVDDKMHSRSTGPYSLITQQPLGGKAQRGGQRFGEMEVWALEAYGAAYTLCEMLTVKSDDTEGRLKMFENITEGDLRLRSGIPEAFNVLVQEIRAMGMDMDFE